VVDVAINRHGGVNLVVPLHAADRHRDVMDHAKAFAVIRESMVETAADIKRHAISEGVVRRQNRTARRQPESLHQLQRVGNLHFLLFAGGKRSGLEFLNVLRSVDQQDVLVRCGLRSYEVGACGHPGFQQSVVDAQVFLRRENMRADGQKVVVAVHQLEGKHKTVVGRQL
jgi:hypothetical protein